ncbi:MAG: hypothetical protein IPN47_21155 [Gemmatimonadetes bacterium]|nr:hypothetical protein [Gemmatimonadota bacterium]
MDARSRTVLGQLATRVHALHLLIVTTGRPVVEGRLDDPEARVVELPVLTELQCAELVASIATLGQAEWGGRFTQELWRSTGGSPLHVLETLQLLRERTLLPPDGRGVALARSRGVALALLREGGALARRLDSLPRDQRWLLLLLAVAGSPLGEVRLAAAGGRDVTAESALHELEARGLVARTADGWMIAHDEMTTTVLEHASAESVRAAHAALGRALWQEGTDDLATMRRAGQHLVRGGERSALHALFGGFVRRLRALGDTRAIPALADDLLGRPARGTWCVVRSRRAVARARGAHVGATRGGGRGRLAAGGEHPHRGAAGAVGSAACASAARRRVTAGVDGWGHESVVARPAAGGRVGPRARHRPPRFAGASGRRRSARLAAGHSASGNVGRGSLLAPMR